MSAQLIYDIAPLGSIIRYSDGTPKPPQRFKRKLAAWENSNSSGRLVRKVTARQMASYALPASITLHKGDFASGGVIVMVVHQTFCVTTALKFELVERPTLGSVRVLDRIGQDAELLHLAADHTSAEAWLAVHRHPGAILEEVTADEIVADIVEGRAAA
jgi:hypothetical protein